MDLQKLQELIRLFEQSDLCEIEIEEEGKRMRLKKPQPKTYTVAPIPVSAHHLEAPASLAPPVKAASVARPHEKVAEPEEEALETIDSPMVGVFYASPAPGEPPFARPGDTVSEHQTVCIVEAMKLMNEVTARFAGVIVKALVEHGEPVEYGQPLFSLRRSEPGA